MLRAWMMLTCLSSGYLMAEAGRDSEDIFFLPEQEIKRADNLEGAELPHAEPVGFFPPRREKPHTQAQYVAVPKNSSAPADNPRNPYGKHSIASYSNTEKKGHFFVTGSGLYWKATEENLGYVGLSNETIFQDTTSTPQIHTSTVEIDIKKPHLRYQGGFQVGFGCDFPPETHWDALVNWTDYRTSASGHEHTPFVDPNTLPNPTVGSYQITTLTPLFFGNFNGILGGGTGFFNQASAKWKLHVDLLDLEMGKKMFIGKWVMVRPFFGLRAERIKENYHTNFIQPASVDTGGRQSAEINAHVHMKSNYDGIGIRLGLDSQWKIYRRLSFYGDASASALYGSEKLTSKNILQATDQNSIVDATSRYKNTQNASRAILDFDAGLRWDQMLAQGRCHLGLNIGWAYRYFFNQNQMMRTSTVFGKVGTPVAATNGGAGVVIQNNGYLSLQGLVIGGQLDF